MTWGKVDIPCVIFKLISPFDDKVFAATVNTVNPSTKHASIICTCGTKSNHDRFRKKKVTSELVMKLLAW